jgi:L-ascorbate metabolism protein UlaG (beta-lactamase superfamily)
MALDRQVRITWYGHACFEIVTPGGKVVLLDPWFGNPSSPRAAASVDRCDVMLVTHGHGDHLGDAFEIARRTHPVWPQIHELSLWTSVGAKAGDRTEVIGMNKGGTVEVRGLRVTMVPAEHSAGNLLSETDDAPVHLGEPVGFVIEMEDGYRVYHAGDTAVFSDMRLIRDLFAPDLALLPIGGHYTMDPRGAALAVELLGVEDVIPMHYGTFPILAGTPAQLEEELGRRGLTGVTVHAPKPGETVA